MTISPDLRYRVLWREGRHRGDSRTGTLTFPGQDSVCMMRGACFRIYR